MLKLKVKFPDGTFRFFHTSKLETPRVIAAAFSEYIPKNTSISISHCGELLNPHLTFSIQQIHDYDVLEVLFIKPSLPLNIINSLSNTRDEIRQNAKRRRLNQVLLESWKIADDSFRPFEMRQEANIVFEQIFEEITMKLNQNKNDDDKNSDENVFPTVLDDGFGNLRTEPSSEPLPTMFNSEIYGNENIDGDFKNINCKIQIQHTNKLSLETDSLQKYTH